MTYSAQHLLVRWGGSFGPDAVTLVDEWSCSVRIFIGATPLTEAKKQEFIVPASTAVAAWWAANNTQGHPSAWLRKVTAAYIGLDGKYVGGDSQPTTEFVYGTPTAGKGGITHPWSTACVVTLSSDIDRGRGARGRFYIPTGLTVLGDGMWAAINAQNVATTAKTLVDTLNTAARASWSPASAVSVFSHLDSGTIGTVTKVGVGRAPDTQRRRDNKIPETRVDIDLATTFAARDAVQDRVYA